MSPDFEVHHFTYGPLTPVLAYGLSVLGSLLGLHFTTRALAATEHKERIWWLTGGSVALGGTAIWVMHFVGMLGFSVSGTSLAYEVPLTLFSAVLAVVFVGAGLFLVGFGMPVPLGGLLAGTGVVAMHYTGMAAMNVGAETSYDPVLVVASVVIAVVAATASLFFGTRVRGWLSTLGAALVMGVAVSGMHYTGMFALNVHSAVPGPVEGADPVHLLVPLTGVVSVVTAVLCAFVGGSASPKERRKEAEFVAGLERELGTGY
ncbi:MHYT domain-containing protein [Actinocorallia populi]|uniref:MHYT domain-containing protein n=1 Tax=Actinocorallia populi TaxID=2079200 RepID=UPI000D08B41B|nr:MHYT domain-containing protein [Actinocorallia populi]